MVASTQHPPFTSTAAITVRLRRPRALVRVRCRRPCRAPARGRLRFGLVVRLSHSPRCRSPSVHPPVPRCRRPAARLAPVRQAHSAGAARHAAPALVSCFMVWARRVCSAVRAQRQRAEAVRKSIMTVNHPPSNNDQTTTRASIHHRHHHQLTTRTIRHRRATRHQPRPRPRPPPPPHRHRRRRRRWPLCCRTELTLNCRRSPPRHRRPPPLPLLPHRHRCHHRRLPVHLC